MPHFFGQSHKLWLELSQPMVAKGFFIKSIAAKGGGKAGAAFAIA